MKTVLGEAVVARSRTGLWLALSPVRLWLVLLLGYGTASRFLPGAAGAAVLAVTAPWAWWSTRVLARRAHAVESWLRERVHALGGDPTPAQPVSAPTAYEVNARNAPHLLQSAESAQLEFMRDPGGVSHRVLAIAGLALSGSAFTLLAIADDGLSATLLSLPPGALMLLALGDLYRGRVRRWPRLWLTAPASWPSAWRVVDPPSKMLGPIWLGLVLAIALVSNLVSHADSVGQGINLALLALGAFAGLWACRSHLGALAVVERSTAHRWLAQALIAAAPALWHLARAFQFMLVGFGVVASVLSPIDAYAAYVGLLAFGIALVVRAMRRSWQRPRSPELIALPHVAKLFGERHLERRLTAVSTFVAPATCIWFFIAEISR